MMDEDLEATCAVLKDQWSVRPPAVADADLNWELLIEALAERIAILLEENPRKLLTALYVLDIAEWRFKEAMTGPTLQARARSLAQTILERETEKIRTRRKYAGQARQGITDESRRGR